MQKSLEEIAVEKFKKNIQYFEENQPITFSKLAAYDSAVEQGLYQEKYDLVLKDNYFDVVELSSGEYLYGSDSNKYASLASNSVNFEKDSNLFETFKKIQVTDEDALKYADCSIIESNLSGFASILNYTQKNIKEPSTLKSIQKFIFFGVGLGLHVTTIDEKIAADVYLFVEDDIELFRLSLFTTSYFELATKSTLFFSIFETKEEFSIPALGFINREFYHNHYIKYFEMLNQNGEKLQEFHLKIASQSHNLFFYNKILEQYVRPLEYFKEHYKFLNILEMQKELALQKNPVLLLGAGPSLGKNIAWIKENQDKFIIVALSATMSILEKEGITPDIVTHIDGMKESIVHFKKLKALSFFKDTTFLISSRTPQEIVQTLDKNNVFFFETGTSYKKDFGNLSAACVGSTTYLLLLALNVKNLYLMGLDLALDSKSGSTHSDGHQYAQKIDLNQNSLEDDTITFKSTLLNIAGNMQESVYTTPDYLNSIESINTTSKGFKQESQSVYNLSDGAYLINTQPTKVEDTLLQQIDKTEVIKSLKSRFNLNSTTTLTEVEKEAINARYQYALVVEKVILEQRALSFNSPLHFLNSLITLFDTISRRSNSNEYDLALIYQEYFKFIYSYIFDFFNTKEREESINAENEINSLLCQQLLTIVDIYKKRINL